MLKYNIKDEWLVSEIMLQMYKLNLAVQLEDRCTPWKISNGSENFVCSSDRI
jgi:hypothetical protein